MVAPRLNLPTLPRVTMYVSRVYNFTSPLHSSIILTHNHPISSYVKSAYPRSSPYSSSAYTGRDSRQILHCTALLQAKADLHRARCLLCIDVRASGSWQGLQVKMVSIIALCPLRYVPNMSKNLCSTTCDGG